MTNSGAGGQNTQELYSFSGVSQSGRDHQICHFGSVYQSILACAYVSAIYIIIAVIVHCYQGFYEIINCSTRIIDFIENAYHIRA